MTVVTPRVLVVSESRITRRVVEMTFADQPMELVTAVTGAAGLDAWNAVPAAVVLADVVMAAPDGLALARHVQATAGPRPAAVLLLAGQNDPVDPAAVAAADVRGVIRKPLDSLQLIEAVREVLRTARPPKAAPVEVPVMDAAPSPMRDAAPAYDVAPVAAPEADVAPAADLEAEPCASATTGDEASAAVTDRADTAPPFAAADPDAGSAAPAVLGDADLERVAARVAAIWGGDAQYEARVQALMTARTEDLAVASATAVAERLVRELAPAVVQQVARLVVTDVSERLVREEIARMRAQHGAR